jgi:hypothetical protein
MVATPEKPDAVEETKRASPSPSPSPEDAKSRPATENGKAEEGDVSKSEEGSEGEVEESDDVKNPPLPNEPLPSGPPLPKEPVPTQQDDGWDCLWDANAQAWYFYNRFTGKTQWDNPRVSTVEATAPASGTEQTTAPLPPAHEKPAAGGYNPAIHGDYDPNAWYAQGDNATSTDDQSAYSAITDPYAASVAFNRFTGQFQAADAGPDRHSDEAKSRRQMNAFFDVDAAANSHDGRSLKAERSNKKPSKSEVKAFKEKRRARKEEKRRAWLRD